MPDKTIATLQKEIVIKEKNEKVLKERISKWRTEALEANRKLKTLIEQYERVIIELKRTINDFKSNAFKLFMISLIEKFKKWKEGRR